MANQETQVNNLVINELTKEQFIRTEVKSETELYFVTDESITMDDVSGLSTALSEKQNKLTAGDGITITGNIISSTGGGMTVTYDSASETLIFS